MRRHILLTSILFLSCGLYLACGLAQPTGSGGGVLDPGTDIDPAGSGPGYDPNGDDDQDGLLNKDELTCGSELDDDDSDEDGLGDLEECTVYHSNPQLGDSDADGLDDFTEVHTTATHPANPDTDCDGTNDFDDTDRLNVHKTVSINHDQAQQWKALEFFAANPANPGAAATLPGYDASGWVNGVPCGGKMWGEAACGMGGWQWFYFLRVIDLPPAVFGNPSYDLEQVVVTFSNADDYITDFYINGQHMTADCHNGDSGHHTDGWLMGTYTNHNPSSPCYLHPRVGQQIALGLVVRNENAGGGSVQFYADISYKYEAYLASCE